MLNYTKYFIEITADRFTKELILPYDTNLRNSFRNKRDTINPNYFLTDSEITTIFKKIKTLDIGTHFDLSFVQILSPEPLKLYEYSVSGEIPDPLMVKKNIDDAQIIDSYEGFIFSLSKYDAIIPKKGRFRSLWGGTFSTQPCFFFRKDESDWFWVIEFDDFKEHIEDKDRFYRCDQLEGFLKFLEVKLSSTLAAPAS